MGGKNAPRGLSVQEADVQLDHDFGDSTSLLKLLAEVWPDAQHNFKSDCFDLDSWRVENSSDGYLALARTEQRQI